MKKCKIDDYACMIEDTNILLKKNDFHSFGFPTFDPLLIEKMDIEQGGNRSVTINLKFRKVHLRGMADAKMYKISGFEADPDKNKIEMRFKTPKGTIEGPYAINGKMLILPIQGKGNITLELYNLDVALKFLTKKVIKDGKIYMGIEKSKLRYTVTGARVKFTNLFNGDKVLGDNMNAFLNENWQILLDELQKPISDGFGEVFRSMMDQIVLSTPYEDLFLH